MMNRAGTQAGRRMRAGILGMAACVALWLSGCASAPAPATLTVRNDAMQAVDVHFAVLNAEGNPATAGEGGVQHVSVEAGGAATVGVSDPTGALDKAARGSIVMRALVTLAGAGPEVGQWVDLSAPGPWVVRATPFGPGIKAERVSSQSVDDRQLREIVRDEPPRPGRASRP